MSLSSGFSAYLERYTNTASRSGYIVMAVVVVLIVVSFALSFIRINKTILGISYELQSIINNINHGKGDLTARINTKTKTELALISDCINQFLDTLQGVIKDVKEGAGVLSSSSDNAIQVIDFINNNVLADYDAFVDTGIKYENTATMIEEMLDTFSEKADNLNSVMNDMADRIESISSSVQESSSAIGMSAAAATDIVGEIQGISEAVDQNNDVTKQLNESTQKFEIV